MGGGISKGDRSWEKWQKFRNRAIIITGLSGDSEANKFWQAIFRNVCKKQNVYFSDSMHSRGTFADSRRPIVDDGASVVIRF